MGSAVSNVVSAVTNPISNVVGQVGDAIGGGLNNLGAQVGGDVGNVLSGAGNLAGGLRGNLEGLTGVNLVKNPRLLNTVFPMLGMNEALLRMTGITGGPGKGEGGGGGGPGGPGVGGAPYDRPAWQDQREIDPATGLPGLMRDPYKLSDSLNTQGLEALRTEGLRTGPSAWRNLAGTQLDQQLANQRDALQQQNAGGAAQARARLAMAGGLRSGANERLGSQAFGQNLLGQQGLSRLGTEQKTALDIADEQKRMGTLAQLPGMERDAEGFKRDTRQYNIDTALKEQTQKRLENMNAYNEQMRAWAAMQTANAIPQGGGGGLLSGIPILGDVFKF